MDPYLEDPAFWRDFHGRFIYAIDEFLLDRLPPDYDAAVDEQVRLIEVSPDDERAATARDVLPDVAVTRRDDASGAAGARPEGGPAGTATLEPVTIVVPTEQEVRDRWIELRHRPDNSLITVIEVLSPTHKTGDGFGEYRAKRAAVLRQKVSLVELDLLAGGRRVELAPDLPPGDYYAIVSRNDRPGKREVYAWAVRRPLPVVSVPLRPADGDVQLDLASAFATAFERGRYGRRLRYAAGPSAPLADADRAWAESVARQGQT